MVDNCDAVALIVSAGLIDVAEESARPTTAWPSA